MDTHGYLEPTRIQETAAEDMAGYLIPSQMQQDEKKTFDNSDSSEIIANVHIGINCNNNKQV